MTSRLLDPRNVITRAADADHGVVTLGHIVARQSSAEKKTAQPERNQLYIRHETITWYRTAVGAVGDAAYLMRVPIPTSDTTWNMGVQPVLVYAQCRILLARLRLDADRTAGSMVLRVRVIEASGTTDYDLSDMRIDGTTSATRTTREVVTAFAWDTAVQVSAGSTLEARLVTTSWTPNTVNSSAVLTLGAQEWT